MSARHAPNLLPIFLQSPVIGVNRRLQRFWMIFLLVAKALDLHARLLRGLFGDVAEHDSGLQEKYSVATQQIDHRLRIGGIPPMGTMPRPKAGAAVMSVAIAIPVHRSPQQKYRPSQASDLELPCSVAQAFLRRPDGPVSSRKSSGLDRE